jgi:hypothetical protein
VEETSPKPGISFVNPILLTTQHLSDPGTQRELSRWTSVTRSTTVLLSPTALVTYLGKKGVAINLRGSDANLHFQVQFTHTIPSTDGSRFPELRPDSHLVHTFLS